MDDYAQLLKKKARDALPKELFEKERFEIPKVRGHIQGARTIISNFNQIASTLRRQPEHVLKFVLRELATPGEIKRSGSVIIGAKIPASRINEKIRQYANAYVFCSTCGKPDTKIDKEKSTSFLVCSACGARYLIKGKL